MNVSCPQCKTVFRLDPDKVPTDGVRARCSVCGGVFEVGSEKSEPLLAAVGAPTVPEQGIAETPAVAQSPPEPAADVVAVEVEMDESLISPVEARVIALPGDTEAPPTPSDVQPEEEIEEEPESLEASEMLESAVAQADEAPAAPSFPFAPPDQDARARRLARVLISDLAAYHPERQEKGLAEGRLKELFQDELRKSWQEYTDQVGIETAKSTPYFRDALNDILAKGKRVF